MAQDCGDTHNITRNVAPWRLHDIYSLEARSESVVAQHQQTTRAIPRCAYYSSHPHRAFG